MYRGKSRYSVVDREMSVSIAFLKERVLKMFFAVISNRVLYFLRS